MEIIKRSVELRLRDRIVAHEIELVRMVDGRWSSDALFALRYGDGVTVYRRALSLPGFPSAGPIRIGAADFPPFRELAPELLGWANRPSLGIKGFETSAASENNDRDEVRFARLLEAHLPPELLAAASSTRSIGDRCVSCGRSTAPGSDRFVNRVSAAMSAGRAEWLPAAERLSEITLEGWSCAACLTPSEEARCICPACVECEDPAVATVGDRCVGCAEVCPPFFAPTDRAPSVSYRPISGVYLHGTLEDLAGTDQLLAVDAPTLADWLLGEMLRVESEAYLLLGDRTIEAVLFLWRRGAGEVRGLLVDSADEAGRDYAEARASERSDAL